MGLPGRRQERQLVARLFGLARVSVWSAETEAWGAGNRRYKPQAKAPGTYVHAS